jgi:hypothetical protein
MSPAEREQIRVQVVTSRRHQGLPDRVEDADTLDRLAAELAGSLLENADAPGSGNPRRHQPSTATKQQKGCDHHATVA